MRGATLGVFENAFTRAVDANASNSLKLVRVGRQGVAGWLFERLRRHPQTPARLAVVERVSLAQRQSLVLVEADGHRLLVATSPEGAPAFYALPNVAPVRANYPRKKAEGKKA
jgi:flagellar biogenesis protein FliO